jgi:hypothetical protein
VKANLCRAIHPLASRSEATHGGASALNCGVTSCEQSSRLVENSVCGYIV